MPYPGPAPVDFAEVVALNRAFLALVTADANAAQYLRGLDDTLAERLRGLSPAQCERLASAPFLLFSLGEEQADPWADAQEASAAADLFAHSECLDAPARLLAAALGFIWQLARRNPHSLRLLTGASLHWCERLAEQALVDVVDRAGLRPEALVLRAAGNANVWRKLLSDGVRQRETLRVAAQLSAMHMMLTGLSDSSAERWAAAACRRRAPTFSVAEEKD